MIRALRKAYGGGFRAGMAAPRFYIHGGRRVIKTISAPLNPYNNAFAPRWRPLLALIWEAGQYDGMMKRLTNRSN